MRRAPATGDIRQRMLELGERARAAARELASCGGERRSEAIRACAGSLRRDAASILDANACELASARKRGLSPAMLDRMALDDDRVAAMAGGLEKIAAFPDPVGRVLAEWDRPNGLHIQRVSVPLGVIGMVFESRPNVTADAAGLCLKSGNAVILRGGSECFESNLAIHRSLVSGLQQAGVPTAAVQMVPTTDREAVSVMLTSMTGLIDVVVPRGGRRLIERVRQDARVPVIGHLEGICHVYLHGAADPDMAKSIVLNAKMRRPGICGAAETVLVDRAAAARLLPPVVRALQEAGCEVRGDEEVRRIAGGVLAARDADWSTEYLDAIISIRVVDGLDEAVSHIGRYGSGHTESIVTADAQAAKRFLECVDSAIVLHNASTQFADGGEFGMGAEIGIATGKIHARGPVGAEQLTSYKYVVHGAGQVRPA